MSAYIVSNCTCGGEDDNLAASDPRLTTCPKFSFGKNIKVTAVTIMSKNFFHIYVVYFVYPVVFFVYEYPFETEIDSMGE